MPTAIENVQIATIVHNALYNNTDKSLQDVAYQYIHPYCEFIDPMVHCKNKNELVMNFLLVCYLHPESKINHTTSEKGIVIIDAVITYWLVFIPLRIRQLSKIRVNEGKCVKIEDIWSVNDMLKGLPIIGYFIQFYQFIFGYLVSTLAYAINK